MVEIELRRKNIMIAIVTAIDSDFYNMHDTIPYN